MPDNDNNLRPGTDIGDTLTGISEMISSAKKKVEQESKAAKTTAEAPALNENKAQPKPDISFTPSASKSAPAAKPAAPKPSEDKISSVADKAAAAAEKASQAEAAPKPAQAQRPAGAPQRPAGGQPPKRPAPPKRRPPQRGGQPSQNGTQNGARPQQGKQGGVKPAPAANAQGGARPAPVRPRPSAAPAQPTKPAPAVKKPAPAENGGKAQPKKTALERFDEEFAKTSPKPEPAEKKPAGGIETDREQRRKAALERYENEFGKNAPKSSDGEKKPPDKKKLKIVIGLVIGLFLLLALAVVLIIDHYLGLFDRTGKKKWQNSEAPTYSDVDFSRPDTMDTMTADEKLKELRGKAEMISNEDVMNILLIGEDLRDTATEEAGNTDVMMVISVNKKDRTITETSIMRDCYVYFPDYGYSNRINAAYWHGGIELTQKTIEDYLGLKIDRYVLVNFKVFIDIVDTLGGLDLTVTDDEANGYPGADPNGDNTRGMQNPLDEQNKYLGNKKGTDYIKKGGDLHLNGNQSLAYARLRHVGNSDYERTARQRKVIKEMIKKSKKLSIIEMDRLANKIFPQIKTDVTEGEMAELLIEMLDYRRYKVQEFRVPMDDTYTNQVINGMDVLDVDFYTNSEMLKKKVYGSLAEENAENSEAEKTIE